MQHGQLLIHRPHMAHQTVKSGPLNLLRLRNINSFFFISFILLCNNNLLARNLACSKISESDVACESGSLPPLIWTIRCNNLAINNKILTQVSATPFLVHLLYGIIFCRRRPKLSAKIYLGKLLANVLSETHLRGPWLPATCSNKSSI